jgi:hypothetical protein
MSLSFPCPGCHALITVPEEHEGRHGQCPRCRHLFEIPGSSPETSEPTQSATPTVYVPPADPWAPRSEEPEVDETAPPAEKPKPKKTPAPPAAPMRLWPWAVGVVAAGVMLLLLFAAIAVLAFWRKPERTPEIDRFADVQWNQGPRDILQGRMEGDRVIPVNGMFQMSAELLPADGFDLDNINCHAKVYRIELSPNRDYDFEMSSDMFNCELRLESNDNVLREGRGMRGVRPALFRYRPFQRETLAIHVTSLQPAVGQFRLTVREQNVGF